MAEGSVACGKCGTETFEGAHFCTVCGSQLTPVAPPVRGKRPAIDTKLLDLHLADIDQSFDALIDPAASATAPAASLTDRRASFRSLAQEQLRPIREYMIELQIGDPAPEWLAACRTSADRL